MKNLRTFLWIGLGLILFVNFQVWTTEFGARDAAVAAAKAQAAEAEKRDNPLTAAVPEATGTAPAAATAPPAAAPVPGEVPTLEELEKQSAEPRKKPGLAITVRLGRSRLLTDSESQLLSQPRVPHEFTRLYKLGLAMGAARDLKKLAETVLDGLLEETRANTGAVLMLETGRELSLVAYRGKCARLPSSIGAVVPEPVDSMGEYRERVLEPIYRDLEPHDAERLLRHDWINARAAAARFDAMAVEIRSLDVQEAPAMDTAFAALIVEVLKLLCSEQWLDAAGMNRRRTEEQREVGDAQPEEEDDDAGQRAIGLVVGAESAHVEPEGH